jgi:small subunit ribosomal protein S3
VIGKKGEDIENLKAALTKLLNVPVAVNIEEVRKPEIDAQLIADSITQQLEKRIMFRRAMKRAMQNAMRLGAQGIKIMSSGRLNGIEIARCEWYREGRVPLHTLKADIDYGFSEAKTTYGVIGCKVWVYRGDRLANGEAPVIPKTEGEDDRRGPRRPRPGDDRGRGAPRSNDRGPRGDAPRADAGAPGAADATKPAVKRVMRKAVAPVVAPATTEGKGE